MVKKIIMVWFGDAAFTKIVRSMYNALVANNIQVKVLLILKNAKPRWNPRRMYLPIPLVRFSVLPMHYIAYQIEQPNSKWFSPAYVKAFARADIVWNFYALQHAPDFVKNHRRAAHFPFCIEPPKRSININPNIDVCFVGTMNDRRRTFFTAIRNKNLNLIAATQLTTAEHETLLLRSKIYLNIHYYDGPPGSVLESARITYAISRNRFVVSEPSFIDAENTDYGRYVAFGSTPEDIALLCEKFAKLEEENRTKWVANNSVVHYAHHSIRNWVRDHRAELNLT